MEHCVVLPISCKHVVPPVAILAIQAAPLQAQIRMKKSCVTAVIQGVTLERILMRAARYKSKQSMDPAVFLEGALRFARMNKLDFTAYDTQYQALQCSFLPLLKDGAVIGVISLNTEGEYQYKELVLDPTQPGAPRGG